jgi:two-component system response regulator AtoC
LPEALFESELFGYEKGAFTGAVARKPGRVELAQGGTLFLDEVGELSPLSQVKLLRLVQEKEFERLGGTETLRADLRLVAATHRHLEEMVEEGTFREDLLYRLNVVPITLPPLRARPGDVEALVSHFLATLGPPNGRQGVSLEAGAMARLATQRWPGNVRQLENFIERLLVLAPPGDVITTADVEVELSRAVAVVVAGDDAPPGDGGGLLEDRRRDAERAALEEALLKAKGNRSLAARLLGISRRTLYNKLESFALGWLVSMRAQSSTRTVTPASAGGAPSAPENSHRSKVR